MRLLFMMVLLGSLSVKAQTITETFGTGTNQFSIEFVEIGNPGNAPATNGIPNSVGSVPYIYNLGKFEISREQIIKVNYLSGMNISLYNMSWTVVGNKNTIPASGITWNSAARFINWLNTSKGFQPAYNFTTSGVNDNISLWENGQHFENNKFRHKDAVYFLPSVDEWYKGAYGSPNGAWFKYPTGSNSAPTAISLGNDPDTAVYNQGTGNGPADVMNAGGLSQYGTMAQGGNIWEWNETNFDGTNDSVLEDRQVRGGAWANDNGVLISEFMFGFAPSWDNYGNFNDFGFRVAMVPEPSALSLLAVGLGGLAMMRRRRNSKAVDTFLLSIVLLVTLSFPVRATVSLTDGLVGYYKFEGNFNDSSAATNNLVPSTNASLTNDRFGNSNSAMSSNSSSYAYTSSNIGVSGFSSRTVSIWAKGSIDDSAFEYFHFGGGWNPLRPDGAGGNFAISYVPWKLTNPQRQWPEGIPGNIYVDGNYWAYLVTTDPTSLGGLWHQLVYTFDSSNMLSSVYLNGVLQTNNAYADSVDRMNTIPSPLYFSLEGATENITIDDVRVYDRALSVNEVQTLYATESVPEPSALSLLAVGLGGLAILRRRRS